MPVVLSTLTELVAALRIKLNDGDSGAYPDADIILAINTAKAMIEYYSKCYIVTETLTVNTTTPTAIYDLSSIFEIVDVDFYITSTSSLAKLGHSSLERFDYSKAIITQGTPQNWIQENYKLVLDYQPNAAGFLYVVGYGYSAKLTSASMSGTITSIAPPVVDTVLLDYAESELRKARSTDGSNAQLAVALKQGFWSWLGGLK
jgi:hypothetical protein